jgi:hypothetical protein
MPEEQTPRGSTTYPHGPAGRAHSQPSIVSSRGQPRDRARPWRGRAA